MNIKFKKGLELKLKGEITDFAPVQVSAPAHAIVPDDYIGMEPRPDVREGDMVAAGDVLLHDKNQPALSLTSPVAGVVKAIVRGERRRILRVVVEADGRADNHSFDIPALTDSEAVINVLAQSGLLAMMRRRPFDTVVKLDTKPRDIFVNAADTAPLALDPWSTLPADADKTLAKGVEVLRSLTSGNVYVSSHEGAASREIAGAVNVTVSGRHPSGLVGTQISAIAPINKGETVWTLDLPTLWRIGVLFTTGHVDYSTTVAVAGPEVDKPAVVKCLIGESIEAITKGRLADDGRHKRIISGNVLTGTAVDPDGFLRWPYRQISVIAEGDDVDEFMGWASFAPGKMSTSPTFPGHFLHRSFSPDARLLGGRRAMIMSGQFDSVMGVDIMPEYLLRAVVGRDIDEMEALGIYEVAPEDFALSEYVDTSKMPLQQIVRDGLDYLSKETE